MRRFARRLLAIIALVFLAGVAEFALVEGVHPADALFSGFTMFLTGDPGSLHFDEISLITKITATLLIALGAVAVAAIFGLVADFLLSSRLEQFLGSTLQRMENHVILVGLGQVGYKILEELEWFGDEVWVVEAQENEFVVKAREHDNVQVMIGDIHSTEILKSVGIERAKSLIAASDNDLINVEVALNARELCPDLSIVLRMFDQRMARKLQDAFNIRAAFSATALAAPAFAAASHCDTLMHSFHLAPDVLVVTAELEVEAGGKLAKLTYDKLRKELDFTVIRHSPKGRPERLHPQNLNTFGTGDKLTVLCSLETLEKLRETNRKTPTRL